MKFEEFRKKAIALLEKSIPLSVSDIKRETGATSAAYQWMKKLEANGDVKKTAINDYYRPAERYYWEIVEVLPSENDHEF